DAPQDHAGDSVALPGQSLFTQRINSKLIAYESEQQRKEMERKASKDSLEIQKSINEQKKDEQENLESKVKEEPQQLEVDEPVKSDSTIRRENKDNRIRRK
ncbi:MAG: hypothetical protein ACPL25_04225, partial [Ignavibacteria bacterium]